MTGKWPHYNKAMEDWDYWVETLPEGWEEFHTDGKEAPYVQYAPDGALFAACIKITEDADFRASIYWAAISLEEDCTSRHKSPQDALEHVLKEVSR